MLLLVAPLCYSQTNFARPDAHWCIQTSYPTQTTYAEPIQSHDTVLQGVPCSKIPGVGCLFVQNDTVFRILDNGSTHFLYDYSAHTGDVWHIYMWPMYFASPADSSVIVHVQSVDTIAIRGETLRVVNTAITDTPFTNYGYILGKIIEGIGNNHYFLPGPWGLVDAGIPYLSCFYDSAIGAIGGNLQNVSLLDSCVCHVWMGEQTISNEISFRLYPNPATDELTITTETNEPIDVFVYDMLGNQLRSIQKSSANSFKVKVSDLSAGYYLLKLTDKHGLSSSKGFIIAR